MKRNLRNMRWFYFRCIGLDLFSGEFWLPWSTSFFLPQKVPHTNPWQHRNLKKKFHSKKFRLVIYASQFKLYEMFQKSDYFCRKYYIFINCLLIYASYNIFWINSYPSNTSNFYYIEYPLENSCWNYIELKVHLRYIMKHCYCNNV